MSFKDFNLMPIYLPLVVLNSFLLSVGLLYFLRSILVFSIFVPFFAVFSTFLYLGLDGQFKNRIELERNDCEVYSTMKNISILSNIFNYNKKQFSFLVLYFFVIIYPCVFIPVYLFFNIVPGYSIVPSIFSFHLYVPFLILSIAMSIIISSFIFVESTNIYFEDGGYIHVKPFTSELSIDCKDIQNCEVNDKYLIKSLYIETSGEEYKFYTMEADSIQKKIISNRI